MLWPKKKSVEEFIQELDSRGVFKYEDMRTMEEEKQNSEEAAAAAAEAAETNGNPYLIAIRMTKEKAASITSKDSVSTRANAYVSFSLFP